MKRDRLASGINSDLGMHTLAMQSAKILTAMDTAQCEAKKLRDAIASGEYDYLRASREVIDMLCPLGGPECVREPKLCGLRLVETDSAEDHDLFADGKRALVLT